MIRRTTLVLATFRSDFTLHSNTNGTPIGGHRVVPARHAARPCRARPCYGPGPQPMTRHMGRLPVPCRLFRPCHPWATVHACELGGRPWKERERASRGGRGEEARWRRCGRRRRRCGLAVGMRGEEARSCRAGTVPPCRPVPRPCHGPGRRPMTRTAGRAVPAGHTAVRAVPPMGRAKRSCLGPCRRPMGCLYTYRNSSFAPLNLL
jgi:hypothetical protein